MRDAQYLRAQAEFCLEVAARSATSKPSKTCKQTRRVIAPRPRQSKLRDSRDRRADRAHAVWNRLVVNPHLVSIQANRR